MSASGPIVSPTGVVLGGNSRTMALQRVYASGRGADYRQQLIESAGRFGLSGRAVAKLQQPVLVRVADQVPSDPRQLAQLGSDLNRNRTGALSDSELAASRGRALTPETLGQIGAMTDEMGGDATLADLLSRRPRQVMDLMARDGAVTDRERPALQDARTGALTPRGKDFVTKAMVGSVLPDAELLDATPAATLQKLARAAPQLARLANAAPEWDLHQPLQEAVALHARAAADAIPVGALLDQEDLFGHDATPETAALARALELPPRTFSQAVAHYVATASRHPVGQQLMPGFAAGTPQEALTEAFGGSEGRSPAAEGPATPRGATGYASLGGAEPAVAETFYSQLRRTIERKMPARASVEQVRALLRSPGVKQDEVKWSGIEPWLREQHGAVWRDLVLDALWPVEVREVIHSRSGQFKYRAYAEGGARPGTYRELLLTLPAHVGPRPFFGPHWPEPNVLAQVRFDERTGEGGRRVLFLEEIQSDWHEKGRREGYRNSAEVRRIGEALDEAERRAEDYASGDETAYTDTDDLIESPPAGERPAAAAFRLRSELAAAKAAVPQAPFASAWHELVFKRMLRWAAEHGYDQLAWTTGTQQAERYSLAEKVGRLDYDRNRGVLADSPVGAGERTAAVKPEQLADYVGKELARRLLDGTPDASGVVRLEGSDLKVGGAGMRGFYDKILPDFVRRYARQWGADVKDAGVIGRKGARMTVHAVDITPAMRESVIKQGQPLFSFGPRGTAEPNEIELRSELGRPALWHATGPREGVLYLDDRGARLLDQLWQRVFGGHWLAAPGELIKAATLRPLAQRIAAAPSPDAEAAAMERELLAAARGAPDGLAVVRHGVPERAAAARAEEEGHLWQARADAGDPSAALPPASARRMVDAIGPRAAELMAQYMPIFGGLRAAGMDAAEVDQYIAAELGVRLLQRRYGELGLTAAEGEPWRDNYLEGVRDGWGDDGLRRADGRNAGNVELESLAGRHRGLGPAHARAGGGGPGQAFAAPEARLREPERGPAAALFRLWDQATAPVARGGARLGAGISKYRGVSTEARMALRSYQEELFGPGPTPETAALARALELPPRAFSRAVEHYVAAASQHPAGQQLMPGFAAGTPQEALAEMLGPEGVRPPHYLLPAGEPTPVEAADALPRPVYLDSSMRPPVLYLDTDGIGALASLARAAGVTMVTSFRGIYLRPNLVRRLAAAEPDSDLAREVNQAAAQAPGGLAVVSFPGNLTPEMRRRARLEEAGHGWQSDADYGDPDGALSPQRAIALAMLDSAVRVRVGAIYRKALEGLPLLQQARLLASEIGVRLLIGDYADLGLSEGEGAFMARLWLLWVREEVGDEGLARAQAESGSDVAERARELGAPSHAGGGGAAGGAAGRRLDRGPDDGGDTGGRFLPAARGAVLREPERGPAAALFRLWDRATAPVARGAARLGAGISKYRGVSTEARVALRSYGGRARFAALLSERLAREGYEHVADLGYPTAEAGAAATLRLEHHLEQPQDPRFAPRNRMEQRLSDWARQTLDATTVHEVTRGGLTPDALLAGPGHGAVSLDSLDAAERARLERSLADWQRAKADPQVPRSPLKSAPDCCCGATPNSDWPRPMGRHGAGAMSA